MWRSATCALGVVAHILTIQPQTLAGQFDGVVVTELAELSDGRRMHEADVVYPLAILDQVGWDRPDVERAIRQVEDIFGQCGITVTAGAIYRLQAPEAFRVLDESMQPDLLAGLPPDRPVVLLVDRTTDNDVAYSYLESAPVPSRGSAWITRRSRDVCLGVLMAHELGHILLDAARHSSDPGNLMSHTCSFSNVSGSGISAHLSAAQCKRLRER
jgi:hypothetical protein